MTQTQVDPIRVPLVGTYNSRLFLGASGGASSIVGIGVVGTMIVGSLGSGASKDQKFINFIPDKVVDNMTGATKHYVYKRPGFAANSTPSAGNIGTAVHLWISSTNEVISAFGSTNSTIYKDTTSLGSVTGLVNDITETLVGTTPNLVMATDGNKAYYYPSGGALTEITDVDFPGKAGKTITGTFVHLDGYAFIMTTDGNIYNSDLNSVSSWTSTSFLAANMWPDKGVGLARYKDTVVAFGKESVEFFRDVGNATGSPLQKVPEATIHIGCFGSTAITTFEDNVAWVAASNTGSFSVYMLDGYSPVRISTNSIDAFIAQSGASSIYLTSCKINGKTLLFVVCGTQTYVYCVEDQLWHEWSPANGGNILWHQMAASSTSSPAIFSISRTATGGKVYLISMTSPVYTDDSVNYDATIFTSKVDLGTERRKFLHRLTIVGDTTSSSTNLNISYSDDDYDTFSTARAVNLSASRKYLSNLGQFRRRAFRLKNTDSLPIRLEALEFEIRQGMH